MATRTVDITPDKSLIQKLGLTGYSTAEAVSELLDNSIDARMPGQACRIDVVLDYGSRAISVSDDGVGMDVEELQAGLTIARGTKFDGSSLGKFGLGMKSACSTLGREIVITTSKLGSDMEHRVRYDEEAWLKDPTATWKNFEVETRKKTRPWHGTTIQITKLNIPLYPNKVTALRRIFGMRYGAYIKSGQISLHINTRECRPSEPAIQDGSRRELDIGLAGGRRLKGWIGLLERRSIKGEYGVHLYKNRRLIRAHDKFGVRDHPEVARFTGELHLDHVQTNFHKTGFITESPEYMEASEAFKRDPEVADLLRSSASGAPPTESARSVLSSLVGGGAGGKMRARISSASSRALLNGAGPVDLECSSGRFAVRFEDSGGDELYRLEKTPDGHEVMINRKSPVFGIMGNPLFLIGMIGLEAKAAAEGAGVDGGFLSARNAAWSRFAREWSERRKKAPGGRARDSVPLPGYSLARQLEDLHEFLKERFEFDFQFTALSTLEPLLHNAYVRIIYNIDTVRYAGQQLRDLVLDYGAGRFTVLLSPKSGDVEKALEYSDRDTFIVIREYSRVSGGTWAAPEKAWLDLLVEVKRGPYIIGGGELDNILELLLDKNLVTRHRLEAAARRRSLTGDLSKHLGGAG